MREETTPESAALLRAAVAGQPPTVLASMAANMGDAGGGALTAAIDQASLQRHADALLAALSIHGRERYGAVTFRDAYARGSTYMVGWAPWTALEDDAPAAERRRARAYMARLGVCTRKPVCETACGKCRARVSRRRVSMDYMGWRDDDDYIARQRAADPEFEAKETQGLTNLGGFGRFEVEQFLRWRHEQSGANEPFEPPKRRATKVCVGLARQDHDALRAVCRDLGLTQRQFLWAAVVAALNEAESWADPDRQRLTLREATDYLRNTEAIVPS